MALVRRPGDRRVGRGRGRVVPRRAGRAVEAGHGPERGGGDRLVLVVLGFDAGNAYLAERAGLTGVSSHSGRRGLAAELVRRGASTTAVQMAGGLAVAADGRPLRLGREISPLPQTTRTCSAASWHGMQNAPQLSRSVAGGRRARARSRSKMDLRRDVRGGEQQGHAAMAFDPGPCPGRNPAGHLQDALVVLEQSSREDRLVMGDPVAQLP